MSILALGIVLVQRLGVIDSFLILIYPLYRKNNQHQVLCPHCPWPTKPDYVQRSKLFLIIFFKFWARDHIDAPSPYKATGFAPNRL